MREVPTRRAQGNREKLLRGAAICLREKGYGRTTARDLVAASGANLASIGYHFGSKEALLNEAVARSTVEWMDQITAEAFAGAPVGTAERLRRTMQLMVDRFDELKPWLIAFVEAFPPAVRSDELRERLARAYQDARMVGGQVLQRSISEDGLDVSDEVAERLAGLFMALCDGLILQWLLDPDRAPNSAEVIAALDVLMRAIAPSG
jgi:AcrR family transcriptional regulator